MDPQAFPDPLHHLLMVLFFADLYLLIFAALISGLVWVRRRAQWQKLHNAVASTKNPDLQKAMEEIIAARLPTLAGR